MKMRRLMAILHLLLFPSSGFGHGPSDWAAGYDRLYLRAGESLAGQIINETPVEYHFVSATPPSLLQHIPRSAVKFVLYGDATKADRALGLSAARRLCRDPAFTEVTILPMETIGTALVEAIHEATNSIWISAYYLAFGPTRPFRAFYDALREKALAGLDVRLLLEYGPATAPSLKRDNRGFGEELARHGVQVFFSKEARALHKKLLIVDGRLVILGSSNLTVAGTLTSNEMNVRVVSESFVREAIQDFLDRQTASIRLEDLDTP